MSLDQETILTLREERDYAKARASTENARLERIKEEFQEAVTDLEYWQGRLEALELLLLQDAPPAPPAFSTFGEVAE